MVGFHTYLVFLSHAFSEAMYWPAGSYGIPKAASGCPYADGFQWLIGRRYQDTENYNPNNHKSPGFHLDAIVDSKNGIIRSFCMKTDTSTDVTRGSWPPGKTTIDLSFSFAVLPLLLSTTSAIIIRVFTIDIHSCAMSR